MIARILSLPYTLVRLYGEAKRSPFKKGKERLEIFRILVCLNFLKSRDSKKEFISFRIFSFKVYAYSYRSLLNLFNEIFVHGEYVFASSKERIRILDCGANIGMSTIFFKILFPQAEIKCFEPNPLSFKLLKLNVETNKIEGVTLVNSALSDKKGNLDFFIGNEKGSVVASLWEQRNNVSKITVSAILLSEVMGEAKYDLAKIDVEGAEHNIMDDLILSSRLHQIDQYMIEYHHMIDKGNSLLGGFLTRMETAGFQYNVKGTYRTLGRYQDVFLHFYKP